MEDSTEYRLTVKGLLGDSLCERMKKHMILIRENAVILEDNELKWITVETNNH